MFPDWLPSDGWPDRNHQPGQPDGDATEDRDGTAERLDDLIGRIGSRTADEWLAGRTAEALRMDPLVRGPYLEVMVQNGVVILLGELSSLEARQAAGRCVWRVSGVRDVCNRLSVAEPDPYGA